jgi:hypothetical protein
MYSPWMDSLNGDKFFKGWIQTAIGITLSLFFLILSSVVMMRMKKLFFVPYGKRHRLSASVYLILLVVGLYDLICRIFFEKLVLNYLVYDCCLGVTGVVLTLTAAFDFSSHAHVKNPNGIVSGTLSEKATVSYSEMIEHSFYQGLNLCQALFFHALSSQAATNWMEIRYFLLFLVTLPWSFRRLFPVNSFSANYDAGRNGGDPFTLVNVMYRIKKYQYLFYKHFLLHGLNIMISISAAGSSNKNNNNNNNNNSLDYSHDVAGLSPMSLYWRCYWFCLNTSYVMEFFLQTLVKRKHMSQQLMLFLNNVLMFSSSCAAIVVLVRHLSTPLAFTVCVLSWILNFVRNKSELVNVFLLAALVLVVKR